MPKPDSNNHLSSLFEPRDFISSISIIIGFHDHAYRKAVINLLQLRKGDRVVEIGCGTGRNFALLESAIGSGGTIVAIDASEKMLAQADKRAARNGWSNIELVLSDAATYEFPKLIDGVLSTYTLVIIPKYDQVIKKTYQALKNGKRLAILDQKLPSGQASLLVPLIRLLSRPIDYYRIFNERRLWESLKHYFGNVI